MVLRTSWISPRPHGFPGSKRAGIHGKKGKATATRSEHSVQTTATRPSILFGANESSQRIVERRLTDKDFAGVRNKVRVGNEFFLLGCHGGLLGCLLASFHGSQKYVISFSEAGCMATFVSGNSFF